MDKLIAFIIDKVAGVVPHEAFDKSPIVLKGVEGVVLRDILVYIADGYDHCFGVPSKFCGSLFLYGHPVFTEDDLSTKHNTWCMKG